MATEIVTRTHTCKRCGSTTVTWMQSDAGKWYLAEVFLHSIVEDSSDERADRRDFHSKYCGKPEAHLLRQTEIFTALYEEKIEREERDATRERERIEAEAEKLTAWYALTSIEQDDLIDKLEAEITSTLAGVTMDYFTEYLQATSHAAALRAEIDMYLADEDDELDS